MGASGNYILVKSISYFYFGSVVPKLNGPCPSRLSPDGDVKIYGGCQPTEMTPDVCVSGWRRGAQLLYMYDRPLEFSHKNPRIWPIVEMFVS